jgi:hypothetical protein
MAEPTTRDQWIDTCAARFVEAGGCTQFAARDMAISEFNIRCRDEPLDHSPMLPCDQWPAPKDAADDAIYEWDFDE